MVKFDARSSARNALRELEFNAVVRSIEATRGLAIPARVPQDADREGSDCSTQRAGIASPHAAGEGLSGATSDRETFGFISGPAGVVGGVPLTRAMNP